MQMPSAGDAAAQPPGTSPANPVDTLKSAPETSPAAPETPAAETGSDMGGVDDMAPAGAPKGDEEHVDGELTAYQALLSGAYFRDLVSMQPKEHSIYAWVSAQKCFMMIPLALMYLMSRCYRNPTSAVTAGAQRPRW